MSAKKLSGQPLATGEKTKRVDPWLRGAAVVEKTKRVDPWFRDAAVVANTQLSVDKKLAQDTARRTLEAIKRSEGRQR